MQGSALVLRIISPVWILKIHINQKTTRDYERALNLACSSICTKMFMNFGRKGNTSEKLWENGDFQTFSAGG